jgi:uncharacterized SAM-binding protein YcdF (DUF218 family)
VHLFNNLQNIPLIISGGSGDPRRQDLSEGMALYDLAIRLGVEKELIIIEDRSRNTYESSIEIRKILPRDEKRIILVTSAFHMDRSKRFFEKAGFIIYPAPTDHRADKFSLSLWSFIPSADNLSMSSQAIYEYINTIWYTAHNKI